VPADIRYQLKPNIQTIVDSVNFSLSATPASTAGGGGPDVSTFSQLQRCNSQLSDWVACPSGKTPDGKKIIENLRAQISRLEQRQQSQSGAACGNDQTGSLQNAMTSSTAPYPASGVNLWA
jgi:hypothetical protein